MGDEATGGWGLRWSPHWCVDRSDRPDQLVLSAGDDRQVEIDGLDAEWVAEVRGWAGHGTVPLDQATGPVVDRLVEIGALETGAPDGLGVELIGDPTVVGPLAAALDELRPPSGGERLVVVVRSRGPWPTPAADRVHLGVDLALDHHLVIGPLVLPGVTACLTCLDHRRADRWGRPAIPPVPRATRRLALVAALVDLQADLVAGGRSPLVNATITWDLATGRTDRSALYRWPDCPGCRPEPPPGRVNLPWTVADEGS